MEMSQLSTPSLLKLEMRALRLAFSSVMRFAILAEIGASSGEQKMIDAEHHLRTDLVGVFIPLDPEATASGLGACITLFPTCARINGEL